ncbi:MAG: EamA/RhaT family transporter [Sporolactobacillus sp.]
MIDSFRKNKIGIILMFISSLCACVGQLFWKLFSINGNDYIFLAIGFALYGFGAVIMIVAYRFGELSVLQPMLSMNYILTIVLSASVLDESLSFLKILGILTIMIGVILIGGSESERKK